MGQELFEPCTDLHYIEDPDGPSEWLLTRDDTNPDAMWAVELYRDQEAFDRHYANAVIDERLTHRTQRKPAARPRLGKPQVEDPDGAVRGDDPSEGGRPA